MNSRTVLVVEDNEMVRDMVVVLLESSGYRVLAAETPSRAYEMAQAHPDVIDLLLTDVIMPGMNGQELYQRLLEMRPDLPALFVSGYTNDVVVHNGTLEEGINFLQKPFTREQLIGKVDQTLGGTSSGGSAS
jgi:CheY-like chemotaxis protein